MIHSLQLEWRKLAPNRAFKVAVTMYFVLLPLMFLAVKASHSDKGSSNNSAAINMLLGNYKFPQIWHSMSYWASWLTFFLLTYLAVWMVTSEHEFKTSRQNIITGMERNQYLLGKLQMLVMLILGAAVYMVIVATVFGYMAGGFGTPFSMVMIEATRNFLAQTFFYTSFAFMLAIIFKKSGLAMILFFAYILIIERIFYYLIFLQLLGSVELANFLPASAAWFSLPFYMFKANGLGMMEDIGNGNVKFVSESTACYAVLVYSAIFWLISFWRYNKKDL
jgi:ABC-2 type transport system permease protein